VCPCGSNFGWQKEIVKKTKEPLAPGVKKTKLGCRKNFSNGTKPTIMNIEITDTELTAQLTAAILRMTAKWTPGTEAVYETAAAAVEAGMTKWSPEMRAAFIAARVSPPRSLKSLASLVGELRMAVYNHSTSAVLVANQDAVNAELAALGVVIAE